MKLSFIVDMIPVIIAICILCRLHKISIPTVETVMIGLLSSLFIICQTTWIHSYLNGFDLVTSFIDLLWTIFNTGVMILMFLIMNKKIGDKDDRS